MYQNHTKIIKLLLPYIGTIILKITRRNNTKAPTLSTLLKNVNIKFFWLTYTRYAYPTADAYFHHIERFEKSYLESTFLNPCPYPSSDSYYHQSARFEKPQVDNRFKIQKQRGFKSRSFKSDQRWRGGRGGSARKK